MEDIFVRVWDNLLARTEGPLHLRFFMQPAVSIFFAIKAGISDARLGAVPYLWRFMVSQEKRSLIAKESWQDVGKVFVLGLVFDTVYQLLVIFSAKSQSYFYPLESLIVAVCLALVPYFLLRGPVSRLISLFYKRRSPVN